MPNPLTQEQKDKLDSVIAEGSALKTDIENAKRAGVNVEDADKTLAELERRAKAIKSVYGNGSINP